LADDSTVEQCQLTETDFIVVMEMKVLYIYIYLFKIEYIDNGEKKEQQQIYI